MHDWAISNATVERFLSFLNMNSSNLISSTNNDDKSREETLINMKDEEGGVFTDDDEVRQTNDGIGPDNLTFLLAIVATSPILCYIIYKMKFTATPYLLTQLSTFPLAAVQLRGTMKRWIIGFVFVSTLSALKTSTILSEPSEDGNNNSNITIATLFFYCYTALWECSNAVFIFGGKPMLDSFGIYDNVRRGYFASICPVQVKFKTVNNSISSLSSSNTTQQQRQKLWIQHTLHLGLYLFILIALRSLLLYVVGVDAAQNMHPILEAEGIVIAFSCIVNVWNIPPHIIQLFILLGERCRDNNKSSNNQIVQMIYPYGSIYFSTSSRDFWSKWSRPASSLIRHMFYYPLGGKQRAWLSIPIMFLLNASSHFSVSETLMGDKSEVGWMTVFGILGAVATLEVLGNSYFDDVSYVGNGTTEDGVGIMLTEEEGDRLSKNRMKWWCIFRFATTIVALRLASYMFVHKCLQSSLLGILYLD